VNSTKNSVVFGVSEIFIGRTVAEQDNGQALRDPRGGVEGFRHDDAGRVVGFDSPSGEQSMALLRVLLVERLASLTGLLDGAVGLVLFDEPLHPGVVLAGDEACEIHAGGSGRETAVRPLNPDPPKRSATSSPRQLRAPKVQRSYDVKGCAEVRGRRGRETLPAQNIRTQQRSSTVVNTDQIDSVPFGRDLNN
jgi:hypothetical protein